MKHYLPTQDMQLFSTPAVCIELFQVRGFVFCFMYRCWDREAGFSSLLNDSVNRGSFIIWLMTLICAHVKNIFLPFVELFDFDKKNPIVMFT